MSCLPRLPTWSDIKQEAREMPGKAREAFDSFSCAECLRSCRTSKRLIVLVVFIAIYIDNMLTTTVVPVIPDFLFKTEHPEDYKRVKGVLNTPGSKENCEDIQGNETATLKDLANNSRWSNMTEPPTQKELDAIMQNCSSEEIPAEKMKKDSEAILKAQSTKVGLLFASKPAVQLLVNPAIGILTNKLGYSIPMFSGFVIILASTIVFAFGTSYWVLLSARAVQGAGSSCTTVSGMGLIADKYQDDGERGNAMAVALSGLALGVLVGPPFGGVMYQFVGKAAPFVFLAGLAVFDGALQLYVMRPAKTPELQQGASTLQLLKDPYILVVAGAIMFANMGIGMLEPTLPMFMLETMNSTKLEQGMAFLPASISYMCGTIIFGPLSLKMGRWLAAMLGMVLIALSLFVIPFSTTLGHLVVPNMFLGFAIGMVDSAMMPTMGYLVDLRHISVYGSVYAIADASFALGFALGPAVGGVIVETIGFKWMLWIIAIVNLLFAPFLYFLRNPPGNEEKMQLVMNDKCPFKYVTYKQSSEDEEYRETVIGGEEAIIETELEIEEYSNNGRQTTHHTRFVRIPVTHDVEVESDSGESEGPDDDSQEDSSSNSEHGPSEEPERR